MRAAPLHGLVHRASPAPLTHRICLSLSRPSCLAVIHCQHGGLDSSALGGGSPAALPPSHRTLQRRGIHSSEKKSSTIAEYPGAVPPPPNMEPGRAPLSLLPLSMILRSLGTTIVSSSPLLLPPSLRIMGALAHSTNPILNPDRNPLLRYILKQSFYAQFCAGENAPEVRGTIARLKNIGFTGVILGYAKEVVLTDKQAGQLEACKLGEETQQSIDSEIVPWAEGTMETVRLAEPGDFVALK